MLVGGEQVTGNGGGDGPVTEEVGGFGVVVGQGPVGHDQVQFDGGPFGVAVARGEGAADEFVGHDLALAAVVVGGAVGGHRGAVQGPVDADAFFQG
ncbi:hypothetical protein, partial [Nakamurella sp.]|uniref:hypothetical protein n=1 Tax=Nakamurella sp. TaxID=1869182 RepID=UPI003B3BA639